MHTFSLTIQQKSISLEVPSAEAMLLVMCLAREQQASGVQVKFITRVFPFGSRAGSLMMDLEPAKRTGLYFRIRVWCTFTTVDLSERGGPIYCQVMLRQDALIQQHPADPNQVQTIQSLQTRYAEAFRQTRMGGVEASWGVVAAYASTYTVGRIAMDQLAQLDKALKANRAEMGTWIDCGNIVLNKKTRTLKFETLIRDEVVQQGTIYTVKPAPDDPEQFLLFNCKGSPIMKSSTEQNYPDDGKYNFVVLRGTVYIGNLGHFWLSEGGKPVDFAGSVTFCHQKVNLKLGLVDKRGAVKVWDNDSGHFKPHPGLMYQAPFPIRCFKATHVGLMAKERASMERSRQEALTKAPLDQAINEAFNARGNSPDARSAVGEISSKLPNWSNTKIKDKMLELKAITSLKTLAWNPSYKPA